MRPSATAALALTCAALTALTALAQLGAQCPVPKTSNEARLLAFFAAPLAFSPAAAPVPLAPGALAIGGEVSYVPRPPAELERTSLCYTAKSENTQLASVFPRPRIVVGLPFGLVAEGSYLPPVRVLDARPNIASVSLAAVRRLGRLAGTGSLDLAVRAHATFGHVTGPITCSAAALQRSNQNAPCFGSEPSDDTYEPNARGVEGALALWSADGRLGVYGGGGFTSLAPEFRVGFRSGNGGVDTTRVRLADDGRLARGAVFAGVSLRLVRSLVASAELYAVPADATTARIGVRYGVR